MGLKSKKFLKQSYKKLLQESIDTGVPFIDQDFKAIDSSVFCDRSFLSDVNVSRIVWKRPIELTKDPKLIYREKLGPNIDIEMPVGVGPNENLLAAAATVAQDKSSVYRLIPKDQFYFLHGIFKVFIWNWGSWLKIVIDDKLPTQDDKLVFSASRCSNVFWLPLLEKGLAKLYGSYETMMKNTSVPLLLSHLTGRPSESFQVQENKDAFRLIAEEIGRGSFVTLHTKGSNHEVKNDRWYVVTEVRKPAIGGSFRKKVKTTTAMIQVVPTKWEEEEISKRDSRRKEIWIKVDDLSPLFDHGVISHRSKKFCTRFGEYDSQFAFDVEDTDSSGVQEVMMEMTQQKLHALDTVSFSICHVEVNREHRLFQASDVVYEHAPTKERSLFQRISLKSGRYVVMLTSPRGTNIMIRSSHSLKELHYVTDKSPSPIARIWSHAPKFVTRILVKEAVNLEKPTEITRSLHPYCLVSLGGQKARSHVVTGNTLSPNFDGFGAVFYHDKLMTPLRVEVWSHSLMKDTLIGRTLVPLTISKGDDSESLMKLDLTDKQGAIVGSIQLIVTTFDDVKRL